MGLKADLEAEVKRIFADQWTTRNGEKVPEPEELKLDANDAVKLQTTVLYADLDASTNLVDQKKAHFAAEIYEAYLRCAARIIKSENGVITAYDGDRVMAVYIGDAKNTQAVRTAMKINYAVAQIINPALKKQYPNDSYQVRQVVGVDTSELWIARVGIRNDNDLVWVGRAANYAAKLCSESADYPTYITADVFSRMADMVKYSSADHTLMWTEFKWAARGNIVVHRSNWWYTIR